jgi:hypothetical protein
MPKQVKQQVTAGNPVLENNVDLEEKQDAAAEGKLDTPNNLDQTNSTTTA